MRYYKDIIRTEVNVIKYIFNYFNLTLLLTLVAFLIYDRYLGFVIVNLNIPFIPHMRTPEGAVLKYSPLIVLLLLQTYLVYKFGHKKSTPL